jgi:aspartate aminotransferase
MPTKPSSLSDRANAVQPSLTMSISNLAKELRQAGQDVIGFGAGEPDFDTPDFIKAAGIKAIQDGHNRYTPASGIIELKKAICDKLKADQGLSYSPSDIVVSCGAKHSVYNVLAALINPGDEVIIPAPYWVSYPEQTRLVDGVPVVISAGAEQNFKITAEQLAQTLTPRSKVLILNSPSNPTGMLYTQSELEAIAEVVLGHDQLMVMSDEIYEKLIYGTNPHISIAQISDEMKERTVIVNGVSKAYAMTGWRIGYTASHSAIAGGMSRMQSHITSNPTSSAQWAALEALTGPQQVVADMGKEFNKRRQMMVSRLNAIPGISCLEPDGAFYAFPKISDCFGKKSATGVITDSMVFCEYLLKEAQVACVPGIGFGDDTCMRLSYATSTTAIETGLQRIQDWVESLS